MALQTTELDSNNLHTRPRLRAGSHAPKHLLIYGFIL
jgi:hypothetical protein